MLSLAVSALFLGCGSDQVKSNLYDLQLREEWTYPDVPSDNPLTKASVAFGRELFFDKRLSSDSTISCADCHKAESGFADRSALSSGVEGRLGLRNSGTLTNVAYLPYFNRDGGVKSLDRFAIVPIEDHDEMGFNLVLLKERLLQDAHYVRLSNQIYNRPPDGLAVSRALGSYLRTFISDDSPYDRYIYDGDSTALSTLELQGLGLFFGSGKCSTCHFGQDLTDYSFQNNGLYSSYVDKDRGRQRVTDNPAHEGKFRVASLRNISLTSPYMHDGSIDDLPSVLRHYASGGKDHPTKNLVIDSIVLDAVEQSAIIAFLGALTDTSFVSNRLFSVRD